MQSDGSGEGGQLPMKEMRDQSLFRADFFWWPVLPSVYASCDATGPKSFWYDRGTIPPYPGPAMPVSPGTDTQIQNLIDLRLKGDETAKEALLHHAGERLLRLTRRTFRNYPYLRRWEATDDVFQNAMVRLHRALQDVRVESVRHFFNLAGLQIRRELNDLARHYFGPEGYGANHHTDHKAADDAGGSLDKADEPEDLVQWTMFHEHVEKLPEEEREIVNMLFYQGMTQAEASRVLGMPLRTLKRRWFNARTRLHEALNDDGAER